MTFIVVVVDDVDVVVEVVDEVVEVEVVVVIPEQALSQADDAFVSV